MKTKLIFLVLLIVCFSCGTNNKPVSDAQKEKIKGEVKEVVNNIYKGAKEANFEMFIGAFLNSPDFVFINDDTISNYKAFLDFAKSTYNVLINQKGTIVNEKYVILDNSYVQYTADTKWLLNLKDGSSFLQDPWKLQILFKRTDSKWKIINFVECGAEKIVKASETPKELNQIVLHKQFVGTWKGEVAKDTTWIYENKSYGTGFECFIKYTTKGKVIGESKRLCGYDENLDKYFYSYVEKGGYSGIMAEWFTSNSKVEVVKYSDISNPDKASWKVQAELKSPDLYVETLFIDKKPVWSATFTRIK